MDASTATRALDSARDPLQWFAASASAYLGDEAAVDPRLLPEPYRALLVHEGSMTERLERHFGGRMTLEIVSAAASGDRYARWILLRDAAGRCLAFGGVCLDLDRLGARLRADILEGEQPLGRLLSTHGVAYASVPHAFLSVRTTPRAADLLQMEQPGRLFGRRTHLQANGAVLGEVVEVLPRYDAQACGRPPAVADRAAAARPATIAIVGAGFSGTLTAVHLLRHGLGAAGGRVIMLNRSGTMARGVAYGTQSDRHVLNVPAGGMSALDDDPDSFVRFVRQRGTPADADTFVSRHLYGAYLEWLLDSAGQAAQVTLERVTAEALAIEPAPDGRQAVIQLSGGASLRADRVVLAVGNYPPQAPARDDDPFFAGSPRYVADPWTPGALAAVDRRAPVLLVGSGLTMIDVALELRALGIGGRMMAVSRRGLVPLPHVAGLRASQAMGEIGEGLSRGLIDGPHTVRAYVRIVRRLVHAAAARQIDWRQVLAWLRPSTARLWQALPPAERARFLRHVRPFWDVHRHRVAPQAYDAFGALRRTGAVTVMAARIVCARDAGDRAVVRLAPRGAAETCDLEVGTVINCTGPAGDTRRLRDPLIDGLRQQGLLRPDPLGLGIETSPGGALIDANGQASPILYYVGPFSRARDWESTAVPELRRYAQRLAAHLIETIAGAPADASRTAVRAHFNENTNGCSPKVLQALRALGARQAASYPDSARAIARCARHLGVDPGWLALTNGLDEGIRAVAITHLRPTPEGLVPEAIVPQPAFEIFEGVTTLCGGRVVRVAPRDRFAIAVDDLLAAVTPRTRVLFLTNPNNPTGVWLPLDRVEALAARLPPEVLLFVDEAYADFAPASLIPRFAALPRVIVGRTFSKAHGLAGLRLGAIVGQPETLALVRPAIGLFSVNAAVLAAFEAALDDVPHVQAYLREVREGKAQLYAACERLGVTCWRSDANFVLVRAGEDARLLIEMARRRGVSFCDRSMLPDCAGCVRITVGPPEHMRAVLSALADWARLRAMPDGDRRDDVEAAAAGPAPVTRP